jgi:hypothetical protein
MRTPQKSRNGGRQAAAKKKDVNKLRKKAMKSKMMKKTIFTLAGDDTKVRTSTDN